VEVSDHVISEDTMLKLAWSDRSKPLRSSVKIISFITEIPTGHVPNINQKRYRMLGAQI
jgi:hypothetical protein